MPIIAGGNVLLSKGNVEASKYGKSIGGPPVCSRRQTIWVANWEDQGRFSIKFFLKKKEDWQFLSLEDRRQAFTRKSPSFISD